jgi:FAD binding domain/Berberine and berberine like
VNGIDGAVQGRVLHPGGDGYDEARRVFNAMIDRRPAAIVRCAGAEDVVTAVNYARDHELPLSVKGGGHSVAGTAVCEGGVMVDLSLMKGLRVDPAASVALAEPGLTLGEFDAGTQSYGLATTTGVVSMTGLAGLTLGGGIGWLNGRYGLACDNLLEADVVTADGQLRTASDTEHEDLFWAIRGGGGNFGIVTSFRYRLHAVSGVLGGGVTFPPAQARAALRFYHDFARGAPDELSTAASISLDADRRPVVSVAACYCGPIERGEEIVRPLRTFGPPVMDAISPMNYTTLQSAADGGYPPGRLHYWKASFLQEITDDAIDVMLAFASDMPSAFTGIGLQELCGAASRVAPTATAFPHRDHLYDCLILSQWDDPSDTDPNIAWTRQLFEALQPFLEGGVYANNLGAEETDRVRAAYGPNYPRLAAVKAAYDPSNLFRLNHNITPAVTAP